MKNRSDKRTLRGKMESLKELTGKELKQLGLESVISHNVRWIDTMRTIAASIAVSAGMVSTDELRKWADEHNFQPQHSNAWGGIFRGRLWVPLGWKNSKYKANHARRILIWGYQPKGEKNNAEKV